MEGVGGWREALSPNNRKVMGSSLAADPVVSVVQLHWAYSAVLQSNQRNVLETV